MDARTRIGAAVAGGALVLAAVLGTAGVAAAATDDDDAATAVGSCGPGAGGAWGAADPTALADHLADALGVDPSDVTAALDSYTAQRRAERTAAMTERLAERVAEGTITQEQADAMIAAHEAGERVGMGWGAGGHGMGGMRGAPGQGWAQD